MNDLPVFILLRCHRRTIRKALSRGNPRTHVEKVLLLFIESGAVYCVLWVRLALFPYSGRPDNTLDPSSCGGDHKFGRSGQSYQSLIKDSAPIFLMAPEAESLGSHRSNRETLAALLIALL